MFPRWFNILTDENHKSQVSWKCQPRVEFIFTGVIKPKFFEAETANIRKQENSFVAWIGLKQNGKALMDADP
jgi:hypothetical protein